MMRGTELRDLPAELADVIGSTQNIARAYLAGLGFIVQDTARDPSYLANHVLSYLAQDLLQSGVSIIALAREGLLNVAKRELRFLLEASIKIAFVQQEAYGSTVQEKLELFEDELASSKISIKKDLTLAQLPEALREPFKVELGKLFHETSAYVHLTPMQILQSIDAAEAGVSAGNERPSYVADLNSIAERVMAASLVLLFHSVPQWVGGDWLVGGEGATIDWHFTRSRFIAAMDSEYDYKHERQKTLVEIRAAREARIAF
ncbi:hypothetical protein [Brevundimonas variabilis]|uniref:Uncharacterized protein n=1 Tax=Brevundimonas variabilis TaxID=74312 RepID=A0A7W9CIY4_9CAUL|nr:hypothetical protein [Brevundimonas variabilis]MBB5746529.1 hypothetical protein [Brevundimonas variabilis]